MANTTGTAKGRDEALYVSLRERWRPEQVARLVAEDVRLPERVRGVVAKAVPGGARKSYMTTTFRKAVGLDGQLATAAELFPGAGTPDPTDAAAVRRHVERLLAEWKVGADFKARKNRRARKRVAALPSGRRAYNKRYRFLLRLRKKFATWEREVELRTLAQVGKTRLAAYVRREDFLADRRTGYFVAYMTARLGLRSAFTWGAQARPYDEVAEALFSALGRGANWYAVAHVHPAPEVLARLTEGEKGRLVGVWFDVMNRAAAALARLAAGGGLALDTMVVRRGNDSSTWNEAAGAFNRGRDAWIALTLALGAGDVFEKFLPGKALRLMAADVAYMHRVAGSGGLEPDTLVWNDLPKPWDVMAGKARCGRADVAAACERHGIEGKGWTAPRPKSVAAFAPTPELVHGVSVASPALAATLKRLGYFSGKPVRGFAAIRKRVVGKTVLAVKDEDAAGLLARI